MCCVIGHRRKVVDHSVAWCCGLFTMRHRWSGNHLRLYGGPNNWAHVTPG